MRYILPWSPSETARRLHDAYGELAPMFGCSTRTEARVPWDQLPEQMRSLMIATVRAVLIEQVADWGAPNDGELISRGGRCS